MVIAVSQELFKYIFKIMFFLQVIFSNNIRYGVLLSNQFGFLNIPLSLVTTDLSDSVANNHDIIICFFLFVNLLNDRLNSINTIIIQLKYNCKSVSLFNPLVIHDLEIRFTSSINDFHTILSIFDRYIRLVKLLVRSRDVVFVVDSINVLLA